MVGSIVHRFLANRPAGLPAAGTARADELSVGAELEAEDVRWGSWSPRRQVFTVQAVRPADDGMLAVTVHEAHGFERTLSVLPENLLWLYLKCGPAAAGGRDAPVSEGSRRRRPIPSQSRMGPSRHE